jgi:hypothetical protein
VKLFFIVTVFIPFIEVTHRLKYWKQQEYVEEDTYDFFSGSYAIWLLISIIGQLSIFP